MRVSERPNTETPTNTIANTVRALAAKGFGHEDIVVRLKAGGLRISVNGAERIRQMVLKSRRPRMLAGANRSDPGPISSSKAAGGSTQN